MEDEILPEFAKTIIAFFLQSIRTDKTYSISTVPCPGPPGSGTILSSSIISRFETIVVRPPGKY